MGNDKTGSLVGLDVASGKVRWSNGEEPTSYSSPIAVEIGGVRQVVMWNARRLVGVEAQTGERLWVCEWAMRRTDQNTATPCYADGWFYLGGENRGMRSVEVRKSGDKWEVLWTAGDRIGENVSFRVAGDRVVALVDDGELLVFEASGEGYREVRSYKIRGGQTGAPPVLLADGVLVKRRERLVRLR